MGDCIGYDASPKADRIREIEGWDLEKAHAYDAQASVWKRGRSWYYQTIEDTPAGPFETRKAAIEAATRHRDLRIDMAMRPCLFRDISSVLARLRIGIAEKMMRETSCSEMEAYARARQQVPDWSEP